MSISLVNSKISKATRFLPFTLLIVSVLILAITEDVESLGSLFFLISFLFLLIYKPEIGIALIILLSTHSLMFYSYDDLPDIVIGTGLRFNALDLLLIAMFSSGLIKLINRREKALFLGILAVFAIMVTASFLWSLLKGETDWDNGLYTYRIMFTYSFYISMVGHIQNRRQLNFVIKWVFTIVIISTFIQVYEVLLGAWLPALGSARVLDGFQGRAVEISGQNLAYIWNRAVTYSYLALFLSFGALATGKPKGIALYQNIILVCCGTLAFILMLVRVWYIAIAVGVLVILFSTEVKRKKIIVIFSLISIFLLAFNAIWTSTIGDSLDLFNLFTSRFSTLFGVFGGETQHFNTRMIVLVQQIELFMNRPFWGHGFSKSVSLYTADIGAGNTLLRFGIIGMVWVIALIYSMYAQLKNLLKKLPQSIDKGYVLGMVGAVTGIIVGYSFSWDFFTSQKGIFLITTIMALIDRIYQFNFSEKPTLN